MRRVSLIVFYTKDGRILLQDREGMGKPGARWGYFGGGIEEGETPQEALLRETMEELGYNLAEYEFIGEISSMTSIGFVERHVYIAPFPGFSELSQKEGKDMQLFTLEEAKVLKKDDKVIQRLEELGWPPKNK